MSSPAHLQIRHRYGVVAVLDGLGTKSIPHADIRKNIEMTDSLRTRIQSAVDFANKIVLIKPEIEYETRAFQDTFLITCSVDHIEKIAVSDVTFLRRIADFLIPLFISGLAHHIWIRGAFSLGEFYSAPYQVKGSAMSDAANYYDKHKWVGISAAPLAEKVIMSSGTKDGDIGQYFVHWDLSTKEGVDERFVLNWGNKAYFQSIDPILKQNRLTYTSLIDGALRTIELQVSNSEGDVKSKWEKTKVFFEAMTGEE